MTNPFCCAIIALIRNRSPVSEIQKRILIMKIGICVNWQEKENESQPDFSIYDRGGIGAVSGILEDWFDC